MTWSKERFDRFMANRNADRVDVPVSIRALEFDALAARIAATGDVEGVDIVARQRAIIAAAKCAPCARDSAEARLRIWLVKKEAKA